LQDYLRAITMKIDR